MIDEEIDECNDKLYIVVTYSCTDDDSRNFIYCGVCEDDMKIDALDTFEFSQSLHPNSVIHIVDLPTFISTLFVDPAEYAQSVLTAYEVELSIEFEDGEGKPESFDVIVLFPYTGSAPVDALKQIRMHCDMNIEQLVAERLGCQATLSDETPIVARISMTRCTYFNSDDEGEFFDISTNQKRVNNLLN